MFIAVMIIEIEFVPWCNELLSRLFTQFKIDLKKSFSKVNIELLGNT